MSENVHPRADELDGFTTYELLQVINLEDHNATEAVGRALPQIVVAVDRVAERLRAGGRLHYFGAGSSGLIAQLDASECPETFGVAVDVVQAHVAGGGPSEDDRDLGVADARAAGIRSHDVAVGVSASGHTPYVVAALEQAKVDGALIVGIACRPGSPVARMSEVAIEVETGPEVIAGSTRLKAGTAQKLILNMLSTAVFTRLGRTHRGRMVAVVASNAKLRERAARIVSDLTGLSLEDARRRLEEAGGDVEAVLAAVRRA